MVGCGVNEAGAPAIAVAVTNTAIAHHDYEWGLAAVPRCTVWTLMDDSTEDGAAFKNFVFFLMEAETSAIYSRQCGPNYQYTYVDTRNGRKSCIGGPIPHSSRQVRQPTTSTSPWLVVDDVVLGVHLSPARDLPVGALVHLLFAVVARGGDESRLRLRPRKDRSRR